MNDTQMRYRRLFETLGRPLKPEDGVPESELLAAERRLGLRLPRALAGYYRVAGRAGDGSPDFNRLVPPSELLVHSGKLVFFAETQGAALWGTDAVPEPPDDPRTYFAPNDEPLSWEAVNDRCSVFLPAMFLWGATFGGSLPFVSTAAVDPALVATLDRDWSFVGEVNAMRAYLRPGSAVCILEWDDEWRIFAGSTTEAGMDVIASGFGVTWESSVA